MDSGSLLVWATVTAATILVVVAVRYKRNKKLDINLTEFVSLLLATLGIVSSCELLHKAFTIEALKEILGQDIVTLIIGAIVVLWISVNEVKKSLKG